MRKEVEMSTVSRVYVVVEVPDNATTADIETEARRKVSELTGNELASAADLTYHALDVENIFDPEDDFLGVRYRGRP